MNLQKDNTSEILNRNDTICVIAQLDSIILMSARVNRLLDRVKSLKNIK